MVGPDLVKTVLETIEGRGSDHSRWEFVPAINHSVTEEVMPSSCPTISLFQFELVASRLGVKVSW
jgi:hypothetical protein